MEENSKMMKELVQKNRSYRRYYQEKNITENELLDLIDTARLTPSGANKQPIRYMISCTEKDNQKVFACLRWAGYYNDWDGPVEGERPSAYIIMLSPKDVNTGQDEGIIGQTILLSAVEKGMGGCFIANIDREKLVEELQVPEQYAVKLVLALGYPKEKVVIDEITDQDDIKYYRDDEQTHHVPKIRLEDLIIRRNMTD